MNMCDCFTLSRYGSYNDLGSYEFDDHFEISITSVESPGDGQISLSSSNKLFDELFLCYSHLLENDDYNLYIPVEGNPNGKFFDIISL